MNSKQITDRLFSLRDEKYAEFQVKILHTLKEESVIGVRTEALKKLADEIRKDNDCQAFLEKLPHTYFEENQLHSFILSKEKDFEKSISEVEKFLPFVDNWATCDQMAPVSFGKNREKLIPHIERWITSDYTYTVRFAIVSLMRHFLDRAFSEEYLDIVSEVRSEEYYINMARAWFFATALAKQYKAALPYIEKEKLDPWTHNKAIQKCTESSRVSPEHKEYLRSLKV